MGIATPGSSPGTCTHHVFCPFLRCSCVAGCTRHVPTGWSDTYTNLHAQHTPGLCASRTTPGSPCSGFSSRAEDTLHFGGCHLFSSAPTACSYNASTRTVKPFTTQKVPSWLCKAEGYLLAQTIFNRSLPPSDLQSAQTWPFAGEAEAALSQDRRVEGSSQPSAPLHRQDLL